MKIEAIAGVASNTEGDFDTAKQADTTGKSSSSSPISAPIVTKVLTNDSAAADRCRMMKQMARIRD